MTSQKKDYRLFKGNSLLDYAELVETVGINTQPDGIFVGKGNGPLSRIMISPIHLLEGVWI